MTTARKRAREALIEEIKTVARRHLAEQGAAALSLRAVTREVGMVSSAVYRYFPSRDDLLTALVVDAYDAVGAAAEEAERTSVRAGVVNRWLALARAVRSWAVAHPHEYALIYGSPVPGYRAPGATIDPAARVSLVFLRLLAHGVEAGTIASEGSVRVPRSVHSDFAGLRDLVPGVPDAVLARAMPVWASLFGAISLELFGHLHNVISDYASFFDTVMEQSAQPLLGSARQP